MTTRLRPIVIFLGLTFISSSLVAREHKIIGVPIDPHLPRVLLERGSLPAKEDGGPPDFFAVFKDLLSDFKYPLAFRRLGPRLNNILSLNVGRDHATSNAISEVLRQLEQGLVQDDVATFIDNFIGMLAHRERRYVQHANVGTSNLMQRLIFAADLSGHMDSLIPSLRRHCLMGYWSEHYGDSHPAYCVARKELGRGRAKLLLAIKNLTDLSEGTRDHYQASTAIDQDLRRLKMKLLRLATNEGLYEVYEASCDSMFVCASKAYEPIGFVSSVFDTVAGQNLKTFVHQLSLRLIHLSRPLFEEHSLAYHSHICGVRCERDKHKAFALFVENLAKARQDIERALAQSLSRRGPDSEGAKFARYFLSLARLLSHDIEHILDLEASFQLIRDGDESWRLTEGAP